MLLTCHLGNIEYGSIRFFGQSSANVLGHDDVLPHIWRSNQGSFTNMFSIKQAAAIDSKDEAGLYCAGSDGEFVVHNNMQADVTVS